MRKLWLQILVLTVCLVAVLAAKHYVSHFAEQGSVAGASDAAVAVKP